MEPSHQTPVMTEQFSSMECNEFHVSYLLDKLSKAVFHGQAVKTVAYLTVSTAQQDLRTKVMIAAGSYVVFQRAP